MNRLVMNLLFCILFFSIIGTCYAGEVSVTDYGAVGDGSHDDTDAIAQALASGSSVYIPAGWYKVRPGELKISGDFKGIRGDTRSTSILMAGSNGPILTVNSSPKIYYLSIQNLGFVQNTNSSGNRKESTGILISSSGSSFIGYCRFASLLFLGTYHGIRKTGEGGDWNIFTDLAMTNFGDNQVQYGILFEQGSGTGNIFSNSNLVCWTAGIQIGDGSANVGDITFQGLQQGGGGTGIRLRGGKFYGSNFVITGSQWDAGITTSLDFSGMSLFRISGCSFGGATHRSFNQCSNYWIDGSGY